MDKKYFKEFGVTTVEQLVNEGIGDVAMKSVAAKRPQIFGVDTYILGNIVGGLVIGLAVPKVARLHGEPARAAEIIGAGLVAKGLVQLAKQLTAPAGLRGIPAGVVRPVSTLMGGNGTVAAAASMF